MRHPVLATMVVLASSVSAAHAAPHSGWGLKAGPDFATYKGDDVVGVQTKVGGMGGAFYEGALADDFTWRAEALFVSKGFEEQSGLVTTSTTLGYLEFPLLFVANFPVSDSALLNVFAGPTFGFNIMEDLYDQFGVNVEAFEFGGVLGAGAEFDVGSIAIVVDARYAIGVTSAFEDVDAKSRVFGVLAGVKFPLGAGN